MKLERAKGTRDFLPEEKILRQELIKKLEKIFEISGFFPIETPLIERYDILSAKFAAGEGSDIMKEIFTFKDQGGRKLGLRYELTFALARLIGMNPQLKMPFKRYQIGRVFRDGPIKLGRYREFWQCDVVNASSSKMLADAEIISIADSFFKTLNFKTRIEINNRKLLNEIMEFVGIEKSKSDSVIITLDKLNKVGINEVKNELQKQLPKDKVNELLKILNIKGNNKKILTELKEKLTNSQEVIKELGELFSILDLFKINYEFRPSLARGLTYYTGPIFEVYLKNSKVTSSVAGGGRWDNMIGNYIGNNKVYPATGISFGLEPILEAIKASKSYKPVKTKTKVYVIPIKTEKQSIKILQELRENNINADIDLIGRGISNNLNYCNVLKIPYVVFVGERELKKKKLKLRDMNSGKENLLDIKKIIKKLSS